KSQNEVRALVALFHPKPAAPREIVRPLSVLKPVEVPSLPFEKQAEFPTKSFCNRSGGELFTRETCEASVPEKRFELRFSVDAACHAKLEQVRLSLSTKFP